MKFQIDKTWLPKIDQSDYWSKKITREKWADSPEKSLKLAGNS